MLRASALLFLFWAPEFRGCGETEAPVVDLPIADEACSTDADCDGDMCADIQCLAGSCVEVSPFIDRDGDGEAPMPCGNDCDDTDELALGRGDDPCDGVDNDCDGAVDEDGGTELNIVSTGVFDPASVVVPWGEGFAITELTRGSLLVRPVRLDGRIGVPSEVLRLRVGGSIVQVEAAGGDDNNVFFVARTDIGAGLFLIARADEEDRSVEVVDGPSIIPVEGQITDFSIVARDEGWAVGADVSQPEGFVRMILDTLDSSPLLRRVRAASVPAAPLDIAYTGNQLVVPFGDDLVFRAPDGRETDIRRPGTLAARPLASDRDGVVVAYEAEDRFRLGTLEPSGAIVDSPSLVDDLFIDEVQVHRLEDGTIAVIGRTPVLTALWQLSEDRRELIRGPIDFAPSGADQISAATNERALAALGATSTGGSLRIFIDCDAP